MPPEFIAHGFLLLSSLMFVVVLLNATYYFVFIFLNQKLGTFKDIVNLKFLNMHQNHMVGFRRFVDLICEERRAKFQPAFALYYGFPWSGLEPFIMEQFYVLWYVG